MNQTTTEAKPEVVMLSDGTSYTARAEVWDDLHSERAVAYRAFWANPADGCGCPVVGYCSPGGSWPTIRQTVSEFRRLYPGQPIYRNGRICK